MIHKQITIHDQYLWFKQQINEPQPVGGAQIMSYLQLTSNSPQLGIQLANRKLLLTSNQFVIHDEYLWLTNDGSLGLIPSWFRSYESWRQNSTWEGRGGIHAGERRRNSKKCGWWQPLPGAKLAYMYTLSCAIVWNSQSIELHLIAIENHDLPITIGFFGLSFPLKRDAAAASSAKKRRRRDKETVFIIVILCSLTGSKLFYNGDACLGWNTISACN